MNTRILTLTLLLAAVPWTALAQAAFTKITTGSIVNDLGQSEGCSWGDFNNDGYIDLFVANWTSGSPVKNYLYQNNGDGTFPKLTTNSIVTATGSFSGGVWGDFDNDGLLDLYVLEYNGANSFYHNQGNGAFARIPASLTPMPASSVDVYGGAAWGDFDNDGFLDLFVSLPGINNVLYRNNGDGTFAETVASTVASEGGNSATGVWGDYDNDGHLDLFVPNVHFQSDYLYHNNGDGTFLNITDGPVVNDHVKSWGAAWGDYNNDGFLDLVVAVAGSSTLSDRSLLYRNNRDGTFQSVTDGVVGSDTTGSASCAWGDYD
jgi:FG-GAP-like repeat